MRPRRRSRRGRPGSGSTETASSPSPTNLSTRPPRSADDRHGQLEEAIEVWTTSRGSNRPERGERADVDEHHRDVHLARLQADGPRAGCAPRPPCRGTCRARGPSTAYGFRDRRRRGQSMRDPTLSVRVRIGEMVSDTSMAAPFLRIACRSATSMPSPASTGARAPRHARRVLFGQQRVERQTDDIADRVPEEPLGAGIAARHDLRSGRRLTIASRDESTTASDAAAPRRCDAARSRPGSRSCTRGARDAVQERGYRHLGAVAEAVARTRQSAPLEGIVTGSSCQVTVGLSPSSASGE